MKNINKVQQRKNDLGAQIASLSSSMARVGQAGGKTGDIEIHVAGMEQCDIDALVKIISEKVNGFVEGTLFEKKKELQGIDAVIGEVEKLLELKL